MRTRLAFSVLFLGSALACSSGGGGSGPGTGTGGQGGAGAVGGGGSAGAAGIGGGTAGTAGAGATAGSAGGGGVAGAAGGTGGTAGAAGSGGAGASCPAVPPGAQVGGNVGNYLMDIELRDCNDNPVKLSELCGAQALWIFSAHGWCPKCKQVSGYAEELQDTYSAKGLKTAVVLVETAQGGAPGPAECQAWAQAYNLSDVVMLHDPTGNLKAVLDQSITSQSAFIDKDWLISEKLNYVDTKATIQTELDKLLP